MWLSSGWTTPIPWLCMCGMLIGVLMEKTRLANRIALFTISRVGTAPIRMYIAFLLAGFIVSAIIPTSSRSTSCSWP